MKRGRQTQGFTIVEVLIFLAVSGALLLSALFFISGTQGKTQFNQAANDVLQQVNAVVNNVANGYYAGNDDVTCSIVAGKPVATNGGGSQDRGTAKDCVFLGRVLSFDSEDSFKIYDVVGKRTDGAGADIVDISDASPALISGTEQTISYRNGLRFRVTPAGASLKDIDSQNLKAVAFLSTLGKRSTVAGHADDLETKAQQTDFLGINGDVATVLGSLTQTSYDANVNKAIKLCLDSGDATGQRAIITIGNENGRAGASTSMVIDIGECNL